MKKRFCIKCHKRITKGRNLWCPQCNLNNLEQHKMITNQTETPIEGEFPEEVPTPEVSPEEETPNAPEEL